MNHDDCYYLGYVIRSRGLQGDFQVFLDVSDPSEYTKLESVFVEINKQLVPFFLSQIQLQPKGKANFRFEGISSPEMIQEITRCKLYLPLTRLPRLKGKHFYYHEVLGFDLIDEAFGPLGKIEKIQESTAQDLFVVSHKEAEVLIPILDNTVTHIDREKKTMIIQTPEGLIEMYL